MFDRPQHVRHLILEALTISPGITKSALSKSLNIPPRLVEKTLVHLLLERLVIQKKISQRINLYYAAGLPYIHETREFGDQIFYISVLKNAGKTYILVQERRHNVVEGERVLGGILIEYDHVQLLIDFLMNMMQKYNLFQEVSKNV